MNNQYKHPTILFNALPKSASDFISNSLESGLGLKRVVISGGIFPERIIAREILNSTIDGGYIIQDHLAPNLHNVYVLEQFMPKFIFHVRDIRQALLSAVHHLNKVKNTKMVQVNLRLLNIQPSYFEKSLEYQIDFQIDAVLPRMVFWLENWVQFIDDPKVNLEILMTSFEDLKRDQDDFFEKILQFYNIPYKHFKKPEKPKTDERHFRKGDIDEWRVVFKKRQITKCEALIPARLMSRFNWV